jgi:hypothetical protein
VCYDTVCFALFRIVSYYQEKIVKQPVLDLIRQTLQTLCNNLNA